MDSLYTRIEVEKVEDVPEPKHLRARDRVLPDGVAVLTLYVTPKIAQAMQRMLNRLFPGEDEEQWQYTPLPIDGTYTHPGAFRTKPDTKRKED